MTEVKCCPFCTHDYVVPYGYMNMFQCKGGCYMTFILVEAPEL